MENGWAMEAWLGVFSTSALRGDERLGSYPGLYSLPRSARNDLVGAEWAQNPVWALWNRRMFVVPAENRNQVPQVSAHMPVTIPTTVLLEIRKPIKRQAYKLRGSRKLMVTHLVKKSPDFYKRKVHYRVHRGPKTVPIISENSFVKNNFSISKGFRPGFRTKFTYEFYSYI
jgi:hypothetical protein